MSSGTSEDDDYSEPDTWAAENDARNNRCDFEPGETVFLSYPGHAVVGRAVVIEAVASGVWLGVDTDQFFDDFCLVRPAEIYLPAQSLLVHPIQEGFSVLATAVGRTILWKSRYLVRTADVHGSSDQSGSPAFIPEMEWKGKIVKRFNASGDLLSSGRINCCGPEEPFELGTLGEGFVGVTVFDVFIGDCSEVMSHRRWPIVECTFDGGRTLSDTMDHYKRVPQQADPNSHLGGRLKSPYRYVVRRKRVDEKLSAFAKKTMPEVIQDVSSLSCCLDECVRTFRPQDTLYVRTKYWLKGFDERRDYARSVGGQFRFVGNNRKRKYTTLMGQEICATAWYKIHGIPKSTFHEYMDQYDKGVVSSTHGNKDIKRPRIGTVQALGTITAIVDGCTDHMPNQMRTTTAGRVDVLKYLPSGHKWKMVQAAATETNAEYGLPPVSQSAVSRLRKEHFKNVAVKPVGSSFAKCTLCDTLLQFINRSVKGSREYNSFVKQKLAHCNLQASCRRVYHTWREESKLSAGRVLCVIHDKMDTAKTAIPRMRVNTKLTSPLGKLPVNVTGMVTHGHGDGAYAHYSTDLWPGDSNYTISSLARLLRRLEEPPMRETGRMFPHEPANSLFHAMLRGKSRCMDVLPPVTNTSTGPIPLPDKLYLQLDNSAKDNKNQFLMAFLSMLTYKGVFKEIQVGFLLVGHTHEDIDAYFSHLSKTLKATDTYVIADLMKAFMESQDMQFMPEFVQEVADFKSFVQGYIRDGSDRITGLGEMHLFKFYVDEKGWPVMRYKELAVDSHWLPRDKPGIRLWKQDADGNPLIPTGVPHPVPFKQLWGDVAISTTGNPDKAREKASKAVEKRSFIKTGIQGYIKFWREGMLQSSGFAKDFPPYVDYWCAILEELEKPLPPTPSALAEGFWPIHDFRGRDPAPPCLITDGSDLPEDDDPEAYCGPMNQRPKEALNPWRHVVPGSWVYIRPSDTDVYPVWMGKACSAVNCESGHEEYGRFIVQFWEPRNAFKNPKKKYENCWDATWVPEQQRPVQTHVSSVVFASSSGRTNPQTRSIPKKDRIAALTNLDAANVADP